MIKIESLNDKHLEALTDTVGEIFNSLKKQGIKGLRGKKAADLRVLKDNLMDTNNCDLLKRAAVILEEFDTTFSLLNNEILKRQVENCP